MAARWRQRTNALVVTLGVLHCWGLGSCYDERTSVFSEDKSLEKGPVTRERVKRGWVWNQFFVVEEYTGTEPLYVGKVRLLNMKLFYYYYYYFRALFNLHCSMLIFIKVY